MEVDMDIERSHATPDDPSETVPTESDTSGQDQSTTQLLLTALAEIGSIQEEERKEQSDALPKETKCSSEACFYRYVSLQQGFGPVLQLKPSMRKVQEKGSELLMDKIFPLFSTHGSELWTYLQFLFLLVIVVKISVIDIGLSGLDEKNTVDYVFLGLSVIFLFISIVDIWITIFIHKCSLLCFSCRQMSGVEEENREDIDCGGCSTLLKSKYADMVRMVLNEVMVYTILICTMFQLILNFRQGKIYIRLTFGIVSAIVAVLWKIITTYGLSTIVITRTMINLRKSRKGGPAASSVKWFYAYIILYILGLFVSQIAMTVLLGVKMEYENRNFAKDNAVHVSGFLWYMLFSAVIISAAGVFTFVIPTCYSIQEYPIGFFLDFVHSSIGIGDSERGPELETVPSENINIVQNIEVEFTEIHNQSVFGKYAYVFFSPLLVTLSIIYTLLILAFLGCYLLEPSPLVPGKFEVLYASSPVGWTIFAIFSALVSIPHILVLLISIVWIVVIGLLLLFIVVVLILAFTCCICFLAGNQSGRHIAECNCFHRGRKRG